MQAGNRLKFLQKWQRNCSNKHPRPNNNCISKFLAFEINLLSHATCDLLSSIFVVFLTNRFGVFTTLSLMMKIDIWTSMNINFHYNGDIQEIMKFHEKNAITIVMTIVQAIKSVSARKSNQIAVFLSVENGIKNVINVPVSRTLSIKIPPFWRPTVTMSTSRKYF